MELARSQAVDWLLNSKIHNLDPSEKESFGGFNNYYDLRKKKCEYVYTEITAYSVELLLDLFQRTGSNTYLEEAKLAGDWIVKMQDESGGFLWKNNLSDGSYSSETFSFDTAICIGALVDLYLRTDCTKYLQAADKGSEWLVDVMYNADGSFKPSYNVESGTFVTSRTKLPFPKNLSMRKTWFRFSGCHHGKISIGLLKLYVVKKDSILLDVVRRLCSWTMKQQDAQGYFRVTPGSTCSFSHTHCYATEGLLYAYGHLGSQLFLDAAIKALRWLIAIQREDGSIPDWFNSGNPIPSVDTSAVAQAIRLWSILYRKTGKKIYNAALRKAMGYLMSTQHICPGEESSGGFYLVEFDLKFIKYRIKRLYSWPTIFTIHALNLIEDMTSKQISEIDLW